MCMSRQLVLKKERTKPHRVFGRWHWRTADVVVDYMGRASWASWVNHLDDRKDAGVLDTLARLLEIALPDL